MEHRPQHEVLDPGLKVARQPYVMKTTANDFPIEPQTRGLAGARINLLVLALALTLAGGGAWYYRSLRQQPVTKVLPPADAIVLSASTRAVLQHLDTPVDIRFYSILDPVGVPASLVSYAGRVD